MESYSLQHIKDCEYRDDTDWYPRKEVDEEITRISNMYSREHNSSIETYNEMQIERKELREALKLISKESTSEIIKNYISVLLKK